LTAYRIEGWGFRNADNDGLVLYHPRVASFATQSKIIAELHARHIHPLAYLRPFIAPGSAPDREGLTVLGGRSDVYHQWHARAAHRIAGLHESRRGAILGA
jgi:hypothetical protein